MLFDSRGRNPAAVFLLYRKFRPIKQKRSARMRTRASLNMSHVRPRSAREFRKRNSLFGSAFAGEQLCNINRMQDKIRHCFLRREVS